MTAPKLVAIDDEVEFTKMRKDTRRSSGTPQVVRRIVRRLKREYQPVQMFLFGSYAAGRPHADSDVDLLIVKQTRKPFYQRLFEVRQLVSRELDRHPFDPIVMTPKELHERLARGDQFFQDIVTNGKLVHGER